MRFIKFYHRLKNQYRIHKASLSMWTILKIAWVQSDRSDNRSELISPNMIEIQHNTETTGVGSTMNKGQFRFVGAAIGGAIIYLGISLILASISPIDINSLFGGFVTIGLGAYFIYLSTKGI